MATRFFKIIVDPKDDKLRIPPEFIRIHGHNLSEKVTLKAQDGLIREVELVNSDGETWLHKGWEEFKEGYSMGLGHLLVFEFDGNSHFNVLIFDISAVEIQYPLHKNDEFLVPKLEEVGSESEVQENSADRIVINAKKRSNIDYSARKSPRSSPSGAKDDVCIQGIDRKLQRVPLERCAAYERAIAFKSDNPCHISAMQPSYVIYKFVVNLPVGFAREKFHQKSRYLTLGSSDGKTWPIKVCIGTNNAQITSGWRSFAKDNDLKVGDICIFEAIKSANSDPKWNVIIFRS